MPLIDVLDTVGREAGVRDPDWHLSSDVDALFTDPEHPFGELLRQAFAPHIDRDKAAGMARDTDSRFFEGWEREVFGPFFARYGIGDV